jgi:hypothetical protein
LLSEPKFATPTPICALTPSKAASANATEEKNKLMHITIERFNATPNYLKNLVIYTLT